MWKETIHSELTDILKNSPILYKFVGSPEVAKNILSNSQLQFSNPKNFNDPFDCYQSLMTFDKISRSDLEELKKKYANQFPKAIDDINIALSNSKANKILNAYKQVALPEIISRIGITCFSRNFKHNLMWSHYGKAHSGICIGFDIAKMYLSLEDIPENEKALLKINYKSFFESKDFFKDGIEAIIYWLKTKSVDWSYEDEVRLVYTKLDLDKDGKKLIKIGQESIKEIIFGFNFPVKENLTLIDYIRVNYPNTDIYQMRPLGNSFELTRENIK